MRGERQQVTSPSSARDRVLDQTWTGSQPVWLNQTWICTGPRAQGPLYQRARHLLSLASSSGPGAESKVEVQGLVTCLAEVNVDGRAGGDQQSPQARAAVQGRAHNLRSTDLYRSTDLCCSAPPHKHHLSCSVPPHNLFSLSLSQQYKVAPITCFDAPRGGP